jgi:hypothetical protein
MIGCIVIAEYFYFIFLGFLGKKLLWEGDWRGVYSA